MLQQSREVPKTNPLGCFGHEQTRVEFERQTVSVGLQEVSFEDQVEFRSAIV